MKRNHHLNTTYQINPIGCEAPYNKVQNRCVLDISKTLSIREKQVHTIEREITEISCSKHLVFNVLLLR